MTFLLKKLISTYGVGKNLTYRLSEKIGLNTRRNYIEIKERHKKSISNYKKNLVLDKELRDLIYKTVNFEFKNKTYKGLRNKMKYPCRGQRTRTNAKTKKKSKIF
jgi:small subunit ribosomal protein S13